MSDPIIDCTLDPLKQLTKIGEGDNAEFYRSADQYETYKIFKDTCDSYHYQEFLNEVEKNKMIINLVKEGKLAGEFYSQMTYSLDCCKTQTEESFSALIVYPFYQTSLQERLIKSKPKDVPTLEKLFSDTLMRYLILYQVTGMIHGNLTYNNVLISQDSPVLTDFGKMVKKPCIDHIKEFIWFIIPLRDYINGQFDGILRPWLGDLIQPSFVQSLIDKSFVEIDNIIDKAFFVDLQAVFDYWIK